MCVCMTVYRTWYLPHGRVNNLAPSLAWSGLVCGLVWCDTSFFADLPLDPVPGHSPVVASCAWTTCCPLADTPYDQRCGQFGPTHTQHGYTDKMHGSKREPEGVGRATGEGHPFLPKGGIVGPRGSVFRTVGLGEVVPAMVWDGKTSWLMARHSVVSVENGRMKYESAPSNSRLEWRAEAQLNGAPSDQAIALSHV